MSRWFREVGDASRFPAGSVVAIGAFDGVHRGHLSLLRGACRHARQHSLSAVALSFEPLPREFFSAGQNTGQNAGQPPARLTPARMRYQLLCQAGMDAVGLLRFNRALASESATGFVERVLVRGLSARSVRVGPQFRFGHQRQGDIGLLQELGGRHGFQVQVADTVLDDAGQRIGATAIRQALAAGDLASAQADLGRPYGLAGKVIHGSRLGRTLGYPTANIAVRWRPAVQGIFAVRVTGAGLEDHPGVASLGTRPTVGGGPLVLEVHLFDYAGDLYGQRLRVDFIAHLRDEAHFDSLPELVAQMDLDARRARELLAAAEHSRTGVRPDAQLTID